MASAAAVANGRRSAGVAASGSGSSAAALSAGAARRRAGIVAAAAIGRREALAGVALTAGGLLLPTTNASAATPTSVFDFVVNQYGAPVALSKFKGQALVILNVASECPLANVNYPSLRTLYDKYRQDGFNVLAFPCNQFGGQAPGTDEEERAAAVRKFGIYDLEVFDKIDVNGPAAHPLYAFLRSQQPASSPSDAYQRGDAITWNYTKFLVDRQGRPVRRFKPAFDPLEFEPDLRLVLAGKPLRDPECYAHPGRKGCKVERLLAA